MDTHQHDQRPDTEPSVQDLANIMDLELDDQDPVTNSYRTERYDADNEFEDGNVIDVDSIEEDGEENFHDEFNPEKNRSKIGLQSSGFAKAAVIVGGTLAVIGGGAMFFQSQLPKEKVAVAPEKKDPAADKVETAQTAATKAQQSESEIKAELALSKQRDYLAQSNNPNAATAPQPSTTSQATDKQATKVPTSNPTVVAASPNTTIAAAPKSKISNASPQQNRSSFAPVSIPNQQNSAPAQNLFTAKVQPNQSNTFKAVPAAASRVTPKTQAVAKNSPSTAQPSSAATAKNNESLIKQARKLEETPSSPKSEITRAEPTDTAEVMTNNSAGRLGTAKPPGVSAEEPTMVATNSNNAPPPAVETTKTLEVAADLPSITQYMKKAVDETPTDTVVPTTLAVAPQSAMKSADQAATNKVVPTNVAVAPQSASQIIDQTTKKIPTALPMGKAPGMKPSTEIADQKNAALRPTEVATNITKSNQPIVNSFAPEVNKEGSKILTTSARSTSGLLTTETAQNVKTNNKEQVINNSQSNDPAMLNGRPGLMLAGNLTTGTSAKGLTLMPIIWGSDGTSNAKFVLKLEEPLLASNRKAALPAGTQLIVMARPTSNNIGIADVEVVSIIVGGQEYASPAGAFVVRDDSNGLLVGEDFYKRDEQIANRDSMTFITGALGTVGRFMNQPTSTFSSTSSGSFGSNSTNTTTNGSPNILGAVLEGGFKDLPTIWSARNQAALSELASKPKIYQIAKGKSVRIFVNKPINF
jgi:hypothetical protein